MSAYNAGPTVASAPRAIARLSLGLTELSEKIVETPAEGIALQALRPAEAHVVGTVRRAQTSTAPHAVLHPATRCPG